MQEYSVLLPKKNPGVKYEVMKFNIPLKNEFIPNLPGKICRPSELENRKTNKIDEDEDEPKFGAGSSYSSFVKTEKMQKINSSKNNDKTWILNVGSGKSLKSYKGNKEGGIDENCQYFAFMKSSDGKSFEAYPISNWYNFTPIPKYKTLNDEEAEIEFNRRDKVLNHFAIMVQKRLASGTEEEAQGQNGILEDETDSASNNALAAKGRKNKNFLTIRDIDDEVEDQFEIEDDGEDNDDAKSKSKKKIAAKKGKKAEDIGAEDKDPLEESDDGDEEGQELDYMSSGESTSSESSVKQAKTTSKESANKTSTEPNTDSRVDEVGDATSAISLEDLYDEDEPLGVADEPGLRDLHGNELSSDDENGIDNDHDPHTKRGKTSDPFELYQDNGENDKDFNEDSDSNETAYRNKRLDGKDEAIGSKSKKLKKANGENTSSSSDEDDAQEKRVNSDGSKISNRQAAKLAAINAAVNGPPLNDGRDAKKEQSSSESSESSVTSSDDSEIDDNNIKSSIFLQQKKTENAAALAKERQFASIIQESVNKSKLIQQQGNEALTKATTNDLTFTTSIATKNSPSVPTNLDGELSQEMLSQPNLELNMETVKRYLQRRPMTAKELLHKFKKSTLVDSRDQLAERMTAILKQLNPEKKVHKGKMYFSVS